MSSTSQSKELAEKRKGRWMRLNRHHAHYYESSSGFQSVWLSLCNQMVTGDGYFFGDHILRRRPPPVLRDTHIYFLTQILHDSLLTHRFNQGLAALVGLSKKCEKIPELFCLAGLEILKSIPYSHMTCLQFYKNMFLACPNHQPEILLNFALYLVLKQQDVTEALELLKSKSNKLPFSQDPLHKAFIGQFEYILWKPQTNSALNLTEYHEQDDISISDDEQCGEFGEKTFTKGIDFSATHAINLFEEVFSVSGVWDVFVPGYVDLLKSHGPVSDVRAFLENYRDKNRLNPNAHRYLYDFLKSNCGSDEDLLKVLDDLICLVPTSEYLSELIGLKTKAGADHAVIKLIFQKLDHAGCMFDEETWKILESFLIPKNGTEITPELKKEIEVCWKERENWWPLYHFRIPHELCASLNWDVLLIKANIAEYFLGEGDDFTKDLRSKYKEHIKNSTQLEEIHCSSNDQRANKKRTITGILTTRSGKRKKV